MELLRGKTTANRRDTIDLVCLAAAQRQLSLAKGNVPVSVLILVPHDATPKRFFFPGGQQFALQVVSAERRSYLYREEEPVLSGL
jgi:hypothetical protein